jgi:hypothetical protein
MAPVTHYAKAIVALFAAPLTYVAGALATNEPVNWYLAGSHVITAILVWAVPNKPPA